MATITKNFGAVGAGPMRRVAMGDSFTYSVGGTFSGTVVLEESTTDAQAWTILKTITGSDSGTIEVQRPGGALYRFRCSAYTSGTIETSIVDGAAKIAEWRDVDGNVVVKVTEDGLEVPGTLTAKGVSAFEKAVNTAKASDLASAGTVDLDAATGNFVNITGTTTITALTLASGRTRVVRFAGALTLTHGASLVLPGSANITTAAGDFAIFQGDASGVVRCVGYFKANGTPVSFARTAQKRIVKAGAKAGATAGWVVAAGDNVHLVTLPASQTGSTLVIPITGLKVGDTITAYHLIGQIESAGNTATLDADLRKQTADAADVTDASIGAMTQISATADTKIDSANSSKTLATPEVVGQDETFYLLITGTTAAATDIALQGVAIEVTEAA